MQLNQPAQLVGEAKYYFGLPVTAGAVRWRVTRTPVYPFWWGWYGWAPPASDQVIATGVTTVGSDGTFTVAFTPSASGAAQKRGVSYRYVVAADLTDEGGETRNAERAVAAGLHQHPGAARRRASGPPNPTSP